MSSCSMAPSLRLAVLLVILSTVSVEHAFAQAIVQGNPQQSDRVLTRTIEGARPLAKALRALSKQYGYQVSYEDPVYAYEQDLKDNARQFIRNPERYAPGQAPRFLAPRGGVLDLSVLFDTGLLESEDPAQIIGEILLAYRQSRLPGTFALEEVGDRYVVKPTSMRDRSGAVVAQFSPLDTEISFPMQTLRIAVMVQMICEEVSRMRGTRLVLGQFPTNPFLQQWVTMDARKEPARDVLLRVLDRVTTFGRQGNVSWQMMYDPRAGRHILNLDSIRTEWPRSKPVQSPVPRCPDVQGSTTPAANPSETR